MTKIRILHLSDIHFGQERNDGSVIFQDDVRDALTRDSALMKTVLGSAHAIVVTGDVAFGGAKAEYDKAGIWLDALCDTVGCQRNAVHTIPGNHDVDRKKIDYTVELMHDKLRKCGPDDVDEIMAKILGNTDNKTVVSAGATALFDKLSAYREFAARYESDFESEAKPVCVKDVSFPSGHKLRFLGMTSVQVCDANDKRETMILGSNQYIFKPQENVEYVVMCHHPFTWFKDEAKAMPTIRTRGRVLLAGHEHNARFRRIEEDGCEYIMLDVPQEQREKNPFSAGGE
jgi:predicted MPP superfamily phosphohydrolase